MDRLVAELFSAAKPLTHTGALEAAQRRKALGNPPGKGGSLGDGVNWETLLAFGERMEDLCFVSRDGDFASALDSDEFDDFLAEEWAKAKFSSVHFFRDIKSFLDRFFPDIRLASDVRKYFLIDSLLNSSNFAETHRLVAEIARYDSFTLDEAQRILAGGKENSQIRWLSQDDDVGNFVRGLLASHRAALPKTLVARWDFVLAGRSPAYGAVPSEQDIASLGV